MRQLPRLLLLALAPLAIVSTMAVAVRTQPQTPTEVFKAYRTALTTAASYADLLPYMDARSRAMVEAVPDAAFSTFGRATFEEARQIARSNSA